MNNNTYFCFFGNCFMNTHQNKKLEQSISFHSIFFVLSKLRLLTNAKCLILGTYTLIFYTITNISWTKSARVWSGSEVRASTRIQLFFKYKVFHSVYFPNNLLHSTNEMSLWYCVAYACIHLRCAQIYESFNFCEWISFCTLCIYYCCLCAIRNQIAHTWQWTLNRLMEECCFFQSISYAHATQNTIVQF